MTGGDPMTGIPSLFLYSKILESPGDVYNRVWSNRLYWRSLFFSTCVKNLKDCVIHLMHYL